MAPRPKQEDESEGKPTETLDGMSSEHLGIKCALKSKQPQF